uniref:Uncharacterized protein n=1 Tax=Arundo donax TaxID=35708 RepID=A0A0A9F0G7_ARUDO
MAANGSHIFSVPHSALHPAPARVLPSGRAGNPTLLHVSTSLPRSSLRQLGCCAWPAHWPLRRGSREALLLEHSSTVPNLGASSGWWTNWAAAAFDGIMLAVAEIGQLLR